MVLSQRARTCSEQLRFIVSNIEDIWCLKNCLVIKYRGGQEGRGEERQRKKKEVDINTKYCSKVSLGFK